MVTLTRHLKKHPGTKKRRSPCGESSIFKAASSDLGRRRRGPSHPWPKWACKESLGQRLDKPRLRPWGIRYQSATGGRVRVRVGGAEQGGNAAARGPDTGRSLALGPLRAAGCWLQAQPLPPPAPTAWRACGCWCAVNKASLPGRPLATEEGFRGRVPPRKQAAAEGSGPCGLLLQCWGLRPPS